MGGIFETIDEFGESYFPEIFDVLTIDNIRKRKLELCEDGKIRDFIMKKRKFDEIS